LQRTRRGAQKLFGLGQTPGDRIPEPAIRSQSQRDCMGLRPVHVHRSICALVLREGDEEDEGKEEEEEALTKIP